VPPEIVATELGASGGSVNFETLMNRLVAERRIKAQITRAETEDDEAEVELQLLVPRDTLAPFEREVIKELFGDASETSTALIRKRFRGTGFDPDAIVSDVLDEAVPRKRPGRWHPVMSSLALAAAVAGVYLLSRDLEAGRPPIAMAGGLMVAALVRSWTRSRNPRVGRSLWSDAWRLIPLVLLLLGVGALHLVSNDSLTTSSAAGLTLLALGTYQSILNSARPGIGASARRIRDLQQARGFADRSSPDPAPPSRMRGFLISRRSDSARGCMRGVNATRAARFRAGWTPARPRCHQAASRAGPRRSRAASGLDARVPCVRGQGRGSIYDLRSGDLGFDD
jgi:hypothetical protein